MSKVAIVTGGSRGIGAAISIALKNAGYAVAANYAGNDEAAAKFTAETGIKTYTWSVADYDACAAGVSQVAADLGPVTVLVNNAGLAIEKFATEQTEADWDAVIGLNLKGAYFLATEMARRMVARRQGGNIVNIASVIGLGVLKALSPYAISKAGLIHGTRAMALELAGSGVRVNALAPGYIDTEMNHDFWATPAGEKLTRKIPQRRVGAESDLDGAILLLASNASRYMTGSVVTVDGGFLLG